MLPGLTVFVTADLAGLAPLFGSQKCYQLSAKLGIDL